MQPAVRLSPAGVCPAPNLGIRLSLEPDHSTEDLSEGSAPGLSGYGEVPLWKPKLAYLVFAFFSVVGVLQPSSGKVLVTLCKSRMSHSILCYCSVPLIPGRTPTRRPRPSCSAPGSLPRASRDI